MSAFGRVSVSLRLLLSRWEEVSRGLSSCLSLSSIRDWGSSKEVGAGNCVSTS